MLNEKCPTDTRDLDDDLQKFKIISRSDFLCRKRWEEVSTSMHNDLTDWRLPSKKNWMEMLVTDQNISQQNISELDDRSKRHFIKELHQFTIDWRTQKTLNWKWTERKKSINWRRKSSTMLLRARSAWHTETLDDLHNVTLVKIRRSYVTVKSLKNHSSALLDKIWCVNEVHTCSSSSSSTYSDVNKHKMKVWTWRDKTHMRSRVIWDRIGDCPHLHLTDDTCDKMTSRYSFLDCPRELTISTCPTEAAYFWLFWLCQDV